MSKRKVEVFTAGCPVCEPAVEEVKNLACPSCEVIIHDLSESGEEQEVREKVSQYGIKRLPAVVVDGKLAECCKQGGIDREALQKAGIGQG